MEYLVEENLVRKKQFKERKLRLTDDQRRRLSAKGNRLPKLGSEIECREFLGGILRSHTPAA